MVGVVVFDADDGVDVFDVVTPDVVDVVVGQLKDDHTQSAPVQPNIELVRLPTWQDEDDEHQPHELNELHEKQPELV